MDFKERFQYNIKTDLIGKGGFSKVFRAYDTLLQRRVALKVFSAEASGKYDLINEIRKVINLEHPNLCRYYDVTFLQSVSALGEEERTQVGVIEYLDGGDLKTYLKQHPADLKKLLVDVLHGIAFLHSNGIIHRDLKSQNILIKNSASGPVAKITDFGISKINNDNHTTASLLIGTIEYMAPEQLNPVRYGRGGQLGFNVDLWSFGLMVYDLITNKNPFTPTHKSGGGQEETIANILNEDYPIRLDNLEEPYRTVVQKCLIRKAPGRVQSASELIAVMEETSANDHDQYKTRLLYSAPHTQSQNNNEKKSAIGKSVKINLLAGSIAAIALLTAVFFLARISAGGKKENETISNVPYQSIDHLDSLGGGYVNSTIFNSTTDVLYPGIDNVLDIVIPKEIQEAISVTVSAGTLTYSQADKKCIVNFSGEVENCKVSVFSGSNLIITKDFKVVALPTPAALVGGLPSGSMMPAAQFKAQVGVTVRIQGFPVNIPYTVTGFTFTCDTDEGDIFSAPSQGAAFSGTVIKAIGLHVKAGRMVTIDNIIAKGPDGVIKKIPSIVYYIK